MSLVGIVAISVLAALFLFVLVAGMGVLIWLALRLKKQLSDAQAANALVHAETMKLLTSYQADSRAQLESAKSIFASIRNEVRQIVADHQSALAKTLEEHRQQINAGIEKINAEALTTVAVRLTQVCVRTEKAISVLQQLLLDAEKSPGGEYGAEEFAEEEGHFGTPPTGFALSPTAQLDSIADADAAQQVTTGVEA